MEYSKKYWLYQSPIGEFGGWANLIKFSNFLKPEDAVLDFGCGGGFLLSNLTNNIREGIEVNAEAAKSARLKGLTIYSAVEEIPDGRYDVIISNHALEHCERPLDELKSLKAKLKHGGKIIFYVPCESHKRKYRPNDPNQHLYTWSPINLGNLFEAAGYNVSEVKPFYHRWPPTYRGIVRLCGEKTFHVACRIYGRLFTTLSQVRCIATI